MSAERALAVPRLPAATFAMLLMALAGLLAGGVNTLVADRWAFPAYALSMFGPPLVALLLLKPEPATSLEMLLIALFLFFMVAQHRRAPRPACRPAAGGPAPTRAGAGAPDGHR